MRILIVKPSSLGDVLHTFPSVALMRREVQDIECIDWVCNEELAEMARLCEGVDRVIAFPRKTFLSLGAVRKFLKELRLHSYDIVIDYQGLFRSGFVSFLAKDAIVWGFANARECAPLFYDVKYKLQDLSKHALLKNLELTRAVFSLPEGEPPQARISLPQEAVDSIQQYIKPQTLAVCFSSRWESKNWSLEFFAKVLKEVQTQIPEVAILLLGSKGNAAEGERLLAMLDGKATNLAGKTTLPQLVAVLKNSRALLTVDSGPMHIAAAVGTPCVALFGATTPGLTGPFGEMHSVVTSSCTKAPCMEKQCPLGKDCSNGTSPADVAELCLRKLRDNQDKTSFETQNTQK